MTFIQCKECETIIAIKDLKEPFKLDILDCVTAENSVHGGDLCAACTARHEAERKAAEEATQQGLQTEGDLEGDDAEG